MPKIISQNDYDSKQITDSIRYFCYAFDLVFRNKSMYMDMVLGNSELSFAKDIYYRFMNSVSINWIRLSTLLASNICKGSIAPATSEDRVNVLIIDDSTYSRSCSKKVAMLAKIYDHAKKVCLYGFRMRTLGWTDGNTFLPVNHILLSSSSKCQVNDSNPIDHRSNGYKRRNLALMKGTEAMIDKFISALTPSMQRHLQAA